MRGLSLVQAVFHFFFLSRDSAHEAHDPDAIAHADNAECCSRFSCQNAREYEERARDRFRIMVLFMRVRGNLCVLRCSRLSLRVVA